MIKFTDFYIGIDLYARIIVFLIMIAFSAGSYLVWSKITDKKIKQQIKSNNKPSYGWNILNKAAILAMPMFFITAVLFLIVE